MTKLYTVVPSDLPPGAKIAQTGHGVAAYFAMEPERAQTWQREERNIVCLEARDLVALAHLLEGQGLRVARFVEPDMDDRLTAIAVCDQGGRWLSHLPLAGKSAQLAHDLDAFAQ